MLFQSQQLWLLSAGEDGSVRVWDLVQKSCQAVLKVRPSMSSVSSIPSMPSIPFLPNLPLFSIPSIPLLPSLPSIPFLPKPILPSPSIPSLLSFLPFLPSLTWSCRPDEDWAACCACWTWQGICQVVLEMFFLEMQPINLEVPGGWRVS